MAKHKYTAAEIENIDSEKLAEMLNNLGKDIEQLELVNDYRQKALDKANACLKAVSAVLEMMDKT